MNRYKDQWTGHALESLAALLLAAVAAAMILAVYRGHMKAADEDVLKAQLQALRNQQKVFRVVHGRDPADLLELVYDSYSAFPLGAREEERAPITALIEPGAVMSVAVDRMESPVDPWGTPYEVDPVTGRIHSGTPDYENW